MAQKGTAWIVFCFLFSTTAACAGLSLLPSRLNLCNPFFKIPLRRSCVVFLMMFHYQCASVDYMSHIN